VGLTLPEAGAMIAPGLHVQVWQSRKQRGFQMIEKFATAHWTGGLKDGKGTLSSESGALKDVDYSFVKRFEGAAGTNPEELIGAAHAACYAMFLSALIGGDKITPGHVKAKSTISLDPDTEGGPTVTAAHLVVEVKADAPEDKLRELAEKAKAGCPISKLLKAEITMDVTVG
jgi:lipoyl-dependent peroxiredoxin